MKGLIYKDILCLKKQLMLFCFVLIGVVIVSIMYVLSAKYGNLAKIGVQMLSEPENNLTEIDVKKLGSSVLALFLLIPIAAVEDITNVFMQDGKAGFHKVSGMLPVSIERRVLARFLSVYALFAMGVLIDLCLAVILSALTDLMTFAQLFGIIISAASAMSIFSAFAIFFCFLLGYGKEQYAVMLSILTVIVFAILLNLGKVKSILLVIAIAGTLPAEKRTDGSSSVWGIFDFLEEKAWILLIIAVIVSILSYGASLMIEKRKRGVI